MECFIGLFAVFVLPYLIRFLIDLYSTRERNDLLDQIMCSCRENIYVYKDELVGYIKSLSSPDAVDEDSDLIAAKARKLYFDSVFKDVCSKYSNLQWFDSRINYIIQHPSKIGFDNFKPSYFKENGISAGFTYAMVCYALSKSFTLYDSKRCSPLNHFQNDLMTDMLKEIDEELYSSMNEEISSSSAYSSDEISTYKMEISRIDLKECILNACDNELYTYEDLLKEYYSLSFNERIDAAQQAMGEEWANGHPLIHAQIKYMFCVSGKAVTLISKRLCIDSEDVFDKFIAVSKNPEICGLSSDAALYHRDYGLGAGALYIMLHYLLTGDMPDEQDVSISQELGNYQEKLIRSVQSRYNDDIKNTASADILNV